MKPAMQPAPMGGAALSSTPWTSSIISAACTTFTTCYNRLIAAPRIAPTTAGITPFKASSLPAATSPLGGAASSPSPSQPWTLTATRYSRPIPTPKLLSTAVKSVPITPFKATSLPGFQAAAYPQPPACVVTVMATGKAYARHGYGKPKCSYTCLIAMSLMASQREALKTAEIYKYIQQEFPYYSILPKDNWKNSVRHSLSLGKNFRKVQSASCLQVRKGFLWEFVPQNKAAVMAEVERFLKQEEKELISDIVKLSSTSSTTQKFPAVPQSTENSYSSIQPATSTASATCIPIASEIKPGPENTLTKEELDMIHEQVDENCFEKFLEELFDKEEKTWPGQDKNLSTWSHATVTRKRPLDLEAEADTCTESKKIRLEAPAGRTC